MKVDIIGSGISGLALGIYLQKNGFSTTIYEKHSVAGGLCTGWKRADYTFNGCLHWILGTQDGISFYHFWREIIDIDNVKIDYLKERVEFELPISDRHGNNIFHFINDIDDFEKYLLDIAPEDTKQIKYWTRQVRFIRPHLKYLPPVYIDEPWYKGLLWKAKMASLFPMLFFMLKWARYSNYDFAKRFKNPFLRMAVERLYESEMRMTVLLFAQAYATNEVAGYPHGGSLQFAQQIAEKYKSLGGEIRLKTEVEKIKIVDNKATGLILNGGEQTQADFVVSAADWHWTIFEAIDKKLIPHKYFSLSNPSKEQIFYSFCMLFIGVNKDLSQMPHFFRFGIEPLISPDGTQYEQLEVHVYNYDKSLAPQGKTTMSVNLQTREGDYWISLRKNDIDKYYQQKEILKNEIMRRIEIKFGTDFVKKIEVSDLTTPATYNRYTNNYRGSSQGWTPLNNILRPISIKPQISSIRNFMMVGHWQKAGGGIPVAIHTARDVAWKICNFFGKKFIN